jgi:hypothetical protein
MLGALAVVAGCLLVSTARSAEILPVTDFESARALDAPVSNSAFAPAQGAELRGVSAKHVRFRRESDHPISQPDGLHRLAKVSAEILGTENARSDDGPVTIRAVERLTPFQ